jgi:flavin reductase (DIM6/NTAB) family NADH-FMN oxidoreductase RutF
MKRSVAAPGLLFPNPVMVVGTYDKQGVPNAATLAWGGVASSGPESVSIAVRPSRYTYEALQRSKAFTINLPSVSYAAEADFFGLVSGRDVRKFEVTGLTPVRGDHVDAPFILEFPYSLECAVTHTLDLSAHTLFIGEIKDVKVDESLLDNEQGAILWEKAHILTADSGLRAYRAPGERVGEAYTIGRRYLSL